MEDVAVMGCDRNPHVTVRRGGRSPLGGDTAFPDNRTASARDALSNGTGLPGVEPGPTRLELVVLPLHHRPPKRTTRIERVSPEWRSGALPTELRPRDTPGWSRTSGLCLRRAALFH